MPTTNPVIGDVWAHNGDTEAVAVIAAELGGGHGFQLMGRTGRLINVPANSLRMMWKYTGKSHTGRCSIEGCLFNACALVRNEWCCGNHVPRNQSVRLPGDEAAVATVSGGGSSNCPICNAPRDSSSPFEMIEEVIVSRCACRARWVTLVARGSADDGLNLGEDLQTAYAILESEFCHPIRVLAGNSALRALRRVFHEVSGSSPKFAGIALQTDDSLGTSNITVMGVPSEANDKQAHHTYETGEENTLVVGSEHVKLDGTGPVAIKAVDTHTVTLVPIYTGRERDPVLEYILRTEQFRKIYKPLVRRSAAERLMDEEDLV